MRAALQLVSNGWIGKLFVVIFLAYRCVVFTYLMVLEYRTFCVSGLHSRWAAHRRNVAVQFKFAKAAYLEAGGACVCARAPVTI